MSSGNFGRYARCYDLLYRDKDYASEARWVDELLRREGVRPPGPLLDLGCGTGVHARALAALGWEVTGVDLSADMVALARERTPAAMGGVTFFQGAAAEVELGRTFGAVVSLFHVASYQAAPGELERMLANLARHLAPGGAAVFDFWHGPGVRSDPPAVRRRVVEDATLRVTRLCTPQHWPDQNLVEVRYDVTMEELAGPAYPAETFTEIHRLRYYFLPEVQAALAAAGLEFVRAQAGLSAAPLADDSWYGLVVARKPGR